MEFELDEINIDDWIDIREIYKEGIASLQVLSKSGWKERMVLTLSYR
jgi:hypothetical protein